MKHIVYVILLAILPLIASGQTLTITESLRMLENSQADVMYANEFGNLRNDELDEPFPYCVIRIHLEGDVEQAKMMLGLELGSMYKVEAKNTHKDNMILFLVSSSVRSIFLLCGDGCKSQQLYYGTLIVNKVYTGKVTYQAKEQSGISNEGMTKMQQQMDEMQKQNEEMRKQNERMQEILMTISNNQQQANQSAAVKKDEVEIVNETLVKVPSSFKGNYVIDRNINIIGDSAFSKCKGMAKVNIPNSVTIIGNYSFSECSGLTNVTIPNSVTSIGTAAFYGCSGLTSMNIGNNVTSIGDMAFAQCFNLKKVNIPSSVTIIGEYAFFICRNLTSITIPNSVTTIEDGAFSFCSSLTSVNIPESVTKIGEGAFSNCTSLASISIPSSVTVLETSAFDECTSLGTIYVDKDSAERIKKMLPAELRKYVVEK